MAVPKLVDRDALTRIGLLSGTHGIGGTLKVVPETDTPEFYAGLAEDSGSGDPMTVYVDAERGLSQHEVTAWRMAGNHWLIDLDGIGTREAARELGGGELLLEDSQLRPLGPGEYFQHDLIGCRVVDETGHVLGEVSGLMDNTAQTLLVVRDPSGERKGDLLLPLVEPVVGEVDLAARTIHARPPPGLLELNG